MLYLADKASFSVNLNKITAAKVNVSWVDPRTGEAVPLEQEANTGAKTFSTPDGWEDALCCSRPAENRGVAERDLPSLGQHGEPLETESRRLTTADMERSVLTVLIPHYFDAVNAGGQL